MRPLMLTLVAAVAAGCVAPPRTETVTLRPEMPFKGGSRAAFFSFEEGVLRTLSEESDVDLFGYYDGDECTGGAPIGHWDDPGWLYPVDGATWGVVLDAGLPPADGATVDAVSPLDGTQEGSFIWVKTESNGLLPGPHRVRGRGHLRGPAGGADGGGRNRVAGAVRGE